MPIPIEELVARAQGAGVNLGSRSSVLDELTFALRELLVQKAQMLRLAPRESEDLIHDVLLKVLPHLLGKRVEEGRAEAYITQSLRFASRAVARRQRIHDPSSLHRDDGSTVEVADEGKRAADERLDDKRLVACVREALADKSIPEAHRNAFARHVLDGVSEEELTHEELAKNPRQGVDRKQALVQARNKVYQDVRRGRLAIEARVQALDEQRPASS